MWQIYLGMALFAAPHLWSSLFSASRNRLRQRWGENRYKLTYSAVSAAGVLLLARGYLAARGNSMAEVYLYHPLGYGARHYLFLVILAGFILIANTGSRSHLRLWVGHPFSLGIVLWSTAHLVANGERAVVFIFAIFLLVALVDVAVSLWRGKKPAYEPTWSYDIRGLVAGILLFLFLMLVFHPYVLGVPVA
jgi:uncharacterized membrane protein